MLVSGAANEVPVWARSLEIFLPFPFFPSFWKPRFKLVCVSLGLTACWPGGFGISFCSSSSSYLSVGWSSKVWIFLKPRLRVPLNSWNRHLLFFIEYLILSFSLKNMYCFLQNVSIESNLELGSDSGSCNCLLGGFTLPGCILWRLPYFMSDLRSKLSSCWPPRGENGYLTFFVVCLLYTIRSFFWERGKFDNLSFTPPITN